MGDDPVMRSLDYPMATKKNDYLGLRAIHPLLFAVMFSVPKRKARTSKSSAVRRSASWIPSLVQWRTPSYF